MNLIDNYVNNVNRPAVLESEQQNIRKYDGPGANLPKPTLDEFKKIQDNEAKKLTKGTFLTRNFWSTTGNMAQLVTLGGAIGWIFKDGISKNIKNASKEVKHSFKLKAFKTLGGAVLAAYALNFAIGKLFSNSLDKKQNKLKTFFDSENKTSAVLKDKPFFSSDLGAFYNMASGAISVSKDVVADPYVSKMKQKGMVKHELEHARQYELIARSENGIEKLNYACIKSNAKALDNKFLKAYYQKMIEEISMGLSEEYLNKKINVDGFEMNLVDFVTSVWKVHSDKDCRPEDLPIIINKEHYENVRKKNTPLTPEEESQAQMYFDAASNYPAISFLTIFNPWSDYYQNPLEKEAYKHNPWYTRII